MLNEKCPKMIQIQREREREMSRITFHYKLSQEMR